MLSFYNAWPTNSLINVRIYIITHNNCYYDILYWLLAINKIMTTYFLLFQKCILWKKVISKWIYTAIVSDFHIDWQSLPNEFIYLYCSRVLLGKTSVINLVPLYQYITIQNIRINYSSGFVSVKILIPNNIHCELYKDTLLLENRPQKSNLLGNTLRFDFSNSVT